VTGIAEAPAWGRAWLAEMCRIVTGARQRAAEERGRRLLTENLSPIQRRQYAASGSFEVVGGSTGRRYRIRHGRFMNVQELDAKGRLVGTWCFFPVGGLVPGDILLAQKLALELFEPEALAVANPGNPPSAALP
jgi:hypothetical protein